MKHRKQDNRKHPERPADLGIPLSGYTAFSGDPRLSRPITDLTGQSRSPAKKKRARLATTVTTVLAVAIVLALPLVFLWNYLGEGSANGSTPPSYTPPVYQPPTHHPAPQRPLRLPRQLHPRYRRLPQARVQGRSDLLSISTNFTLNIVPSTAPCPLASDYTTTTGYRVVKN